MADLLLERKVRLLDDGVELTRHVFEAAWCEAWEVMVAEKAWPHATEHRRQWRAAMISCKTEMRAAFLDEPTMFARISDALMAAADRMEVDMRLTDLPPAFIGAIRAYGATDPEEAPGGRAEEAMLA
jgi:hypothetical protein